ncbi:MAG: tRNA pseudouridine(13) synthase TruD [Deltaproteobacteria bacterium]|nr:tRNA pseudouridine(13) synthase TruD [Deltaproteobacteria bacterium]
MKLKQKPEDFVVSESWRFDKVKKGDFRVYVMDKQKLSTFDAIARLSYLYGIPHSDFSFCGLKDKQGRTTQLIAVRGADVDLQDEDLRLKYLGRAKDPLSAANTTSNRFGVTVRDLSEDEVARLPASVAEVNRLGVVNYFDSQRFGSLKHGQGFIAKDLLRGDFEMALKNFMAKPSELDRSNDAKVKAFWRDHWGDWRRRCTIEGADKYDRILQVLRRDEKAFRYAFLRIDPKYRAMQVFTYQSWLWNECVRRFLIAVLPGQSLLALSYQAGKLLFPREAPPDVMRRLREQTFPLLAPETTLTDPDVKKAVEWILGREKLTLEKLVVPDTPEIFFRHEERPLLVFPGKLMQGPGRRDEANEGRSKVYVAFTLPPGAYATLVVRRLFSFTEQANADEETVETGAREPGQSAATPAGTKAPARAAQRSAAPGAPAAAPPKAPEPPPPAPTPKLGFRARQKREKERKAQARSEDRARKR